MINLQEILKQVNQKLGNSTRFDHSVAVADMMIDIIKWHNLSLNYEQAYLTGLIHDYAKGESMSRYEEIVSKYHLNKEALNEHVNLLHAFLGPYIIKEELGIFDQEIYEAICYHTTGHPEMSLLAQVLFVADFISIDRTYDICQLVREEAPKNFNKAIAMKLSYLMKEQRVPHQFTKTAYQKYQQYL